MKHAHDCRDIADRVFARTSDVPRTDGRNPTRLPPELGDLPDAATPGSGVGTLVLIALLVVLYAALPQRSDPEPANAETTVERPPR